MEPTTSTDQDYGTSYYGTAGLEEEDPCENSLLPHTATTLPLLYAAIFLVGVTGNCVLFTGLVRKKGARRLADIFVLNLATSDFLFLVTLPLWVDKEVSGGHWRSGAFLCRGSSYIIAVNMYSSVLFLACLSFDRYLAVLHPAFSRKIRIRPYAMALAIAVWLTSCIIGAPVLASREWVLDEDGKAYCMNGRSTHPTLILALLSLLLVFFLPLLGILACYLSITRKLCSHYHQSGRQDKKLRRSFKIVLAVVTTFVVCWVPFNSFRMLALVAAFQEGPACLVHNIARLGMEASSPLAFANSCLNPIVYFLFDGYVRRAVWSGLACPQTQSHWLRGGSESTDTTCLSRSPAASVHGRQAAGRRRSVSF